MLAEMANWVPALTLLLAKFYGTRPAEVFCPMDSGETKMISSNGAQAGQFHGVGTVLSGVATGAEAFQTRLRKECKPSRTQIMSLSGLWVNGQHA